MADSATEVRTFLSLLYSDDAPGYLPIFTLPGEVTRWFRAADLEAAAGYCAEVAERLDVYFGIGLHPAPLGSRSRGRAEGVIALPGTFVDLDFGTEGHKKPNNPPTLDDALGLLHAFPLPPSLVVLSGHGVHGWHLFRELWCFESDAERQDATALVYGVQATLRERAKLSGWQVDSCFNVAQVLRPPGTWNRKRDPLPVRLLWRDDAARYSPDDFEPFLADLPAWEQAHAVTLPPDLPPVDLYTLSIPPSLRELIRDGDTAGHFESRSEAGWKALRELIAAGCDDMTIARIFLDPRNGVGTKAREQGRAWLAGEIGRARQKPRPTAPVRSGGLPLRMTVKVA